MTDEKYEECNWSIDNVDACKFCSGELCRLCGAGFSNSNVTNCNHDSLERHQIPEDNNG